ncbi:hypothetical protein ANS017_17260 [Paraclostridium bifermentans]|uniref:hypothetical protein n=1 Tax=Paraclostridium bifermentans TaxID=1490 RepID=UPI0021C396E5|nr:hypothetical protein [Paraclostridium bifermentans]GKZ03065.1 hypothetical protein ANS014_14990 [Paraclostridium bifermentans]GKZ07316.1 hypothetical protein ANS015_21990 [Paraclostridium bifermentans]GKZ10342.1 hypothetical protein ANS017_17260 [Paraclostridium bifermentans]
MNLFNEIYDLTYLPLLTPANLIENLNLDNFKNINYSKNEIGIMAQVICEIDKSMIKFYYQFDSKNFIDTIYYYENNEIEFMFDRKKMLSNLRNEFSDLKAL